MIKITGLDKLQRELREAQEALKALDGEIGNVRFDPDDPTSIEVAIATMEQMLDARVGKYADNPIVGELVAGAKEHFRQGILDKAAEARAKGDDDDAG